MANSANSKVTTAIKGLPQQQTEESQAPVQNHAPQDNGQLSAPPVQPPVQDMQASANPVTSFVMDRADTQAAAQPEPMIDVDHYNTAEDKWEVKQVPVILAREMRDRASEGVGAVGLDTSMYDQRYGYVWVHQDAEHPGTVDARAKNYAPVRDIAGHIHAKRKLSEKGWGDKPVVTHGDLVLMACPRSMIEAREYDRLLRQREDREHMQDNTLSHEVLNANGTTVFHKDWRTDVKQAVASGDTERAGLMAQAHIRAAEFAGNEEGQAISRYKEEVSRAQSGASVHAGFRGPMGRGVPESPLLRKYMEQDSAADQGMAQTAIQSGQMATSIPGMPPPPSSYQ